jgi:hypothetical protein
MVRAELMLTPIAMHLLLLALHLRFTTELTLAEQRHRMTALTENSPRSWLLHLLKAMVKAALLMLTPNVMHLLLLVFNLKFTTEQALAELRHRLTAQTENSPRSWLLNLLKAMVRAELIMTPIAMHLLLLVLNQQFTTELTNAEPRPTLTALLLTQLESSWLLHQLE